MNLSFIKTDVAGDYPDYLRDESRKTGYAEAIAFVQTEADIRQILASGVAVTTQGARTGITGGAVPGGGHILNLGRMKRITGFRYDVTRNQYLIKVQPGLSLSGLRSILHDCEFDTEGWSQASSDALAHYLRGPSHFFPPDPTETSASLGGMVACNASGACTYHYGATRNFVESLRVVLAGGDVVCLQRGKDKAKGRHFSIRTESGRLIEGELPSYVMPSVKNAAGFFVQDDMDLVDLFIGSEGTLGVFSEIELRLIPEPANRWAIIAFFPSEAAALRFVMSIRLMPVLPGPVAIEYFDGHSLKLISAQKTKNASFGGIPAYPVGAGAAIYLEYHGKIEELESVMDGIPALMAAAGGDESASWIADAENELERFKIFRHAVPEAVNMLIDERRKKHPELTKLGTDMAVKNDDLGRVMEMYRSGLESMDLEYVIFGHIGNNHVHVNILPRSMEEYYRGQDLYLGWARRVVAMGGTVSAEHGIGKFKVALLREMFGDEGVRQMRQVKRVFDPESLLNRGNLF